MELRALLINFDSAIDLVKRISRCANNVFMWRRTEAYLAQEPKAGQEANGSGHQEKAKRKKKPGGTVRNAAAQQRRPGWYI